MKKPLHHNWTTRERGEKAHRSVDFEDAYIQVYKRGDAAGYGWHVRTKGLPAVKLTDNCRTLIGAQISAEQALPMARALVNKLLGARHQ